MKVVHIMLVEDDQLDVIDIRRTLEKAKILYRLTHAKNGEEALVYLREELPDMVLIDINMPRMNGIELLHQIRSHEEWKHLKCFVITTSEEQVDKQEAAKLGVSGYILKPLKLNALASIDSFNLMIDLMNMKD